MSDFSTRNYMAHGGNELVIGGKLTFLPGAVVEGAEGLLDTPSSTTTRIAVEDSKATSVSALCKDYNRLLTALRESGVLAPNPPDGDEP